MGSCPKKLRQVTIPSLSPKNSAAAVVVLDLWKASKDQHVRRELINGCLASS